MKKVFCDTQDQWLNELVERWQTIGSSAIHSRGEFYVLLAGGNTPLPFYQKLAGIDWPWSVTQLFIVDERWVPSEDERSTYRMIYKCLYPHSIRLERWKTEMPRPQDAATDYEKTLKKKLGTPPKPDLIILGMGTDGHTASLYPKTEAIFEEEKLALWNRIPQIESFKLTITYPMMKHAREIWFLTQGDEKLPWVEKLETEEDFPSNHVHCENDNIRAYHCKI